MHTFKPKMLTNVAARSSMSSGSLLLSTARGRASSTSRVIVKSLPRFDMPELAPSHYHGPLPVFIMQSFLKPDWRNEIAIVDGSSPSLTSPQQINYENLYAQTYSAATALRKHFSLRKGDIAAIMSPNHINYFQTFHGLGLTGAASTTINPFYTESEVRYQLELTRAKVLIAHPKCIDVAKAATDGKIPVLSMDEPCRGAASVTPFLTEHSLNQIDVDSFLGRSSTFDEQDVVTVPFSSGTTGRAKGVMLTHRNITSNVLQTMALEGKYLLNKSGSRGTMLCPLPFYHIYGMTAGMCLPLYVGSKLVFMSTFELQRYLELVQHHKVTRGHVVPPIVLALAKHPLVSSYDTSSLETLMSGAAPLGAEVQVAASKRLKCLVKQAWGMSETSPCGTITPDEMVTSVEALKGTSGQLAPSTEAKIVDPVTGADLDFTQEGELLVRGPQIMKGYFENPAATAATIRPDGWLHTGDIAKFDENGWLYITDRCKELIKVSGLQVAPAEIEALLLTMPQIKDAVVIPVLDEVAGELPRAYVVLQDTAALAAAGLQAVTDEDVMEYVRARVASYKRLRGGVRFVASIPKSPSGKLLRRVQIDIDRAQAK